MTAENPENGEAANVGGEIIKLEVRKCNQPRTFCRSRRIGGHSKACRKDRPHVSIHATSPSRKYYRVQNGLNQPGLGNSGSERATFPGPLLPNSSQHERPTFHVFRKERSCCQI
eukprot:9495242-Pyramimonas_sp.AAC.1